MDGWMDDWIDGRMDDWTDGRMDDGTDGWNDASRCPLLYVMLVWTSCLMHRCVCIWQYILQNYYYKLHFQNLFIYDIPHVSIGTLTAENLDVYTTCDPWDNNIHLTMGVD